MSRNFQIGIFLLNAFVLSLEIALTRIFSVTMFYHFAFMAIGVALFGFGASGVVLYIAKNRYRNKDIFYLTGTWAGYAAGSAILALIVSLSIKLNMDGVPWKQVVKLVIVYLVTAVPFYFSGLILAFSFQKLSDQIARLYLLMLTGSALGCLLVIPLLQYAGGPGAIMVISALAAFSSILLGNAESRKSYGAIMSLIAAVALVIAGFLNPSIHLIDIRHAKGHTLDPEKILFDKWNAFSRIIVLSGEDAYRGGINLWGISEKWDLANNPVPQQYYLEIDNTAGTPITHFTGDPSELEIARYDVTAVVHYLLDEPEVLVVGPGGGKDLLAALAFNSSKIDGAEINPLISEAMRGQFEEFSGGIYDYDPVHVTVSEGRTFIASSRDKYDLIQISLIDTWAAASTGAYALSENNLYTKEAFIEYFEHLSPDGIYSMSRFAFDPPRETLRVVSIARGALQDYGESDPSQCVMVVKQGYIANVMVRPGGFDQSAISTMLEKSFELGFKVIYVPGGSPISDESEKYYELLTTENFGEYVDNYPLDITPSTDDRPFFFYLLPPWQFMKALRFGTSYAAGYNSIAIFTLGILFVISLAVVLIFIILPMLLFKRDDIRERTGTKLRFLGYFICLGLAYILVEIALMQHFTLFLGYPVYSLVAVLMSLLLFSGLGAGWSGRVSDQNLTGAIRNASVLIAIISIVYIIVLPSIFSALIVLPGILRILITIILVFPLGWFMGQPFPLGLRLIERENLEIIPWAWGVNGAASVLGSALALTLAIAIGYRLTLFTGVGVYVVAILLAMLGLTKQFGTPPRTE